MRKLSFVLSLLILLVLLSMPVASHPASKVSLSLEGKVLNVTVAHNVSNPENHYINEILVFLNDKEIIKQVFFVQTNDTQKVSYTIPSLKTGDEITVKTNCSNGGKRSETIVVKASS